MIYFVAPFILNLAYIMNVYQNIAEKNTDAAYEVCSKYGLYEAQTHEDIANNLQVIVARGGETALRKVMALHPDKDVIIELFQKPCDCKSTPPTVATTVSADGTVSSVTKQTNKYILVGALVVSLAIIASAKGM